MDRRIASVRPGTSGLIASALMAAALVAAMICVSCYNDPEGLFFSLRYEQPVNDDATELLDGTSPAGIARVGDAYYLAAGRVFVRGLERESGAWTDAGMPSGAAFSTALAASATRVYASFIDNEAANLGLHYTESASAPFAWTEVSAGIFRADGVKVTAVMAVNGTVFVSTETTIAGTRYFRLYRINEGGPAAVATNVDIPFDSDDPWDFKPIVSMTYGGSEYWFLSGAAIYHGDGSTFALLTGETDMPSKTSLRAIRWSSELGRLVITTGSGMFRASSSESLSGSTPGFIYARTSGGVWERSEPIVLVDSQTSGGYANFTDCLVLPGAAGEWLILAGSAPSIKYGEGNAQNNKAAVAKGYGTFRPASVTGSILGIAAADRSPVPVASATNLGTTLINEAVTGFAVDASISAGDPGFAFAFTAGDGLYSNWYDGSAWEGWFHE